MKSEKGKINKERFFEKLSKSGILSDDPRIERLVESFEQQQGEEIERNVFILTVSPCKDVIENAFSDSNVIHDFHMFSEKIRKMYYQSKANDEGNISTYVPQLARQNPNHFALSICTVDGQRLNLGDTDVEFPLQGCTKPISYCLAVDEHGKDIVHNHVGREPSGEEFNALKVNDQGLPHNPLIESGALMIGSLVQNKIVPSDRFDYVTEKWADLAGGKSIGFNNSVYLSERNAGERNYALCHFMKENGAFPDNVDIMEALEFYIQCCAMTTNANSLAIIAASLANGGKCPLTGKEIFQAETVKCCLSMMYACGMYDYSGEFAFSIGLPAKSALSGAVFVVIPNVLGICTFSPRLDSYGNSVRGVDFFSRFTDRFNFHMFDSIAVSDESKEDPRKGDNAEEVTVEKIIRYSSLGDITALKRIRPLFEELTQGDYDHRTPLHLAASNGHLNVVQYILEIIGEDHVNPRDRWNGTPYDDAIRDNYIDVAGYLESCGGKPGETLDAY